AEPLASELRAESQALVGRVVFDEPGDYFRILSSDQTFINDDLATHYGLPLPGSATGAWVPYGNDPRRGILSHGSVLSVGAKFNDSSPTLRAVSVRTHLLCQNVPPPPPNVNPDIPPTSSTSPCKVDRYAEHRYGVCGSCHNQLAP